METSNHPGSFDYKWGRSTQAVRNQYIILSEEIPPSTDEEKCFLLFMARQEKNVRDAFIKMFEGARGR